VKLTGKFRGSRQVIDTLTLLRVCRHALTRANQKSAAVALLTDWLSGHLDDHQVHFALSREDIQSGQLDAARSESERILSPAPNFAPKLNNLAWHYDKKDDREKVLTKARRAYADTPGWLSMRQGDAAAPVSLLDQAWKGAPDKSVISYHSAWPLSKNGKIGQAAEVAIKVLQSPVPERRDTEPLGAD
jgi:hypothetical protein